MTKHLGNISIDNNSSKGQKKKTTQTRDLKIPHFICYKSLMRKYFETEHSEKQSEHWILKFNKY